MKQTTGSIFFVTLMLVTMTASSQTPADQTQAQEKEVRELVRENEAALNRGDLAFLLSLMLPGYIETDWQGRVRTRAEIVADVERPLPEGLVQTWKFSEVQVVINGDTAIASTRVLYQARFKGKEQSITLRSTDVCVRREGKWMFLASHVSPIPPEPVKK